MRTTRKAAWCQAFAGKRPPWYQRWYLKVIMRLVRLFARSNSLATVPSDLSYRFIVRKRGWCKEMGPKAFATERSAPHLATTPLLASTYARILVRSCNLLLLILHVALDLVARSSPAERLSFRRHGGLSAGIPTIAEDLLLCLVRSTKGAKESGEARFVRMERERGGEGRERERERERDGMGKTKQRMTCCQRAFLRTCIRWISSYASATFFCISSGVSSAVFRESDVDNAPPTAAPSPTAGTGQMR